MPYIKGVQEQCTAACVKHFAANNQETNRHMVSVEMDERTLQEIHLPGFKAAVTEGIVYTVVGSYNKFRGQFCCHNEYLLNKVLKEDWNFDGTVISDWGGTRDMMEALNCGLDIEMGTPMPLNYLGEPLVKAVKEGQVKESILDDKVRRVLRLRYKLGMMGCVQRPGGSFNTPEHQRISLDIAKESAVLLKNEKGILPFNQSIVKTIAVIGDNAEHLHAHGDGSEAVKALCEIPPLQGFKNRLGDSVEIRFVQGYSKGSELKAELMAEAVKAASGSDAAIVFAGLNHDAGGDNEGWDRPDMKLPYDQDELIRAVYEANPKTVVVLVSGSPVEMDL